MAKTPAVFRVLLFLICLVLYPPTKPLVAQEVPDTSTGDEIVAVDIPYALFLSLARYEELTEAEDRGQEVAAELIPVLETIVAHLGKERKKFEPFLSRSISGTDLRHRLDKLDRLIQNYQNELRYRRKALELDRLIEQQNSLLGRD